LREETRPTFFVSVRLWPHSDMHIWAGSFILEPEGIKSLGLSVIWNFSKVTGLP